MGSNTQDSELASVHATVSLRVHCAWNTTSCVALKISPCTMPITQATRDERVARARLNQGYALWAQAGRRQPGFVPAEDILASARPS